MSISEESALQINDALQHWSQGDIVLHGNIEFIHLADLRRAHSPASSRLLQDIACGDIPASPLTVVDVVPGLVVLSQTCDLRRDCRHRPFVEVAPLAQVTSEELEAIRCLKRPAFGYLPKVVDRGLVADLDRIMTVEKAVVAARKPLRGFNGDKELREFRHTLARKWARMAFPDDFVEAAQRMRSRILSKYRKLSEEGAHLRALREIRVAAAPSWDDPIVRLTWWFVRETEPEGYPANWASLAKNWMALFNSEGRFQTDAWIACRLDDLTARDYVESDRFDLDQLSVERNKG